MNETSSNLPRRRQFCASPILHHNHPSIFCFLTESDRMSERGSCLGGGERNVPTCSTALRSQFLSTATAVLKLQKEHKPVAQSMCHNHRGGVLFQRGHDIRRSRRHFGLLYYLDVMSCGKERWTRPIERNRLSKQACKLKRGNKKSRRNRTATTDAGLQ